MATQLKVSKWEMLSRYNQNLRFYDYQPGKKVWLKTDSIKSRENKLAPKRTGPWSILQKMPNGVTFQIRNDVTNVTKIVHHDKSKIVRQDIPNMDDILDSLHENDSDRSSSSSSSMHSDYSPSEGESDDSGDGVIQENRYPTRARCNP